jgi:hypothetical protein
MDHPKPVRPSDGGCNCRSPEEHKALERRVDFSMMHEAERDFDRNERTTAFLRKRVETYLFTSNGHTTITSVPDEWQF